MLYNNPDDMVKMRIGVCPICHKKHTDTNELLLATILTKDNFRKISEDNEKFPKIWLCKEHFEEIGENGIFLIGAITKDDTFTTTGKVIGVTKEAFNRWFTISEEEKNMIEQCRFTFTDPDIVDHLFAQHQKLTN